MTAASCGSVKGCITCIACKVGIGKPSNIQARKPFPSTMLASPKGPPKEGLIP
ncbi:hypothetical protein PCANC_17947 [Puccinia coronata f. sp. avenae]|uniref:Uncharacterized protein n=1 Tax=Puccinia coronata f. sp. avenae TaxID=200324 RepID=A0A2N5UR32_9BASI|nr:hypothetical protein PCANC_17947 [Puccinia coronata f. sp. avenae]